MSLIRFSMAFLLIGVGLALSSQKQALLHSLNQIDQSAYMKQLSGLLELHLMGNQTDEALNLIKELLDSLKQDQLQDDLNYGQQMAIYNTNIDELQVTLARLQKELEDTNDFITITTQELVVLEQAITVLTKQLEILNTQEQNIRDVRASDLIAYNRRVITANKVITALNLILTKLQTAIDAEDAPAVQAILAQISQELGPKHPVTLLITLTTKFDVAVVKRIVEKLFQIRDGAVQSLTEDNESEEVAVESFNASIEEIAGLRKKLSIDLEVSQGLFKTKSDLKVIAEARRDQLNIDIPETEAILTLTIAQRDQYHADYVARTERRGVEIGIVEKAYNLIFDHVDGIKRQEKLADQLS